MLIRNPEQGDDDPDSVSGIEPPHLLHLSSPEIESLSLLQQLVEKGIVSEFSNDDPEGPDIDGCSLEQQVLFDCMRTVLRERRKEGCDSDRLDNNIMLESQTLVADNELLDLMRIKMRFPYGEMWSNPLDDPEERPGNN